MTSVKNVGILSRLTSPFIRKAVTVSLLGAGVVGWDINNSHTKESAAITAGQRLDERFENLTREREHRAAIAELSNQFQQERTNNQQAIIDARGKQEELNVRLAQLEQVRAELQERLQKAETGLSQANGENAELRNDVEAAKTALALVDQSVKEQMGAAKDLAAQITGLKEVQDKTITQEVIMSAIQKSKPSFVTIMDKDNPLSHGSGFITKDINGNYYICTCGHLAKNYDELFKGFIVEGFDSAFKLEVIPSPLADGTVSWHSFKMGDVSFWPLNKMQISQIEEGITKKFGPEARLGLRFRSYDKDLVLGQPAIGLGSPANLTNSVKVTAVGRAGVERQLSGAIIKQTMFEIGHGTTPGESGGPLIGINPETMEPEVIGINTVTFQYNRSIGGGVTFKHVLRAAAVDGIEFDPNPNSFCQAYMDGVDSGLKRGPNLTLVEEARTNASKGIPAGVMPILFVFGGLDRKVDDSNIGFFTSDIFNDPPKPKLIASQQASPEAPLLPEFLVPPPPPEPLTPEPDPKFSKPDDLPPAPGDIPKLQPLPELKRIPAPPIPLQE